MAFLWVSGMRRITYTAWCWPLTYPGSLLSSFTAAQDLTALFLNPLKGKREVQISLIKGDAVSRKQHSGLSPQPAFRAQGVEVVSGGYNSITQLCHHRDSCPRGKRVTCLTEHYGAPETRWRSREVNFTHYRGPFLLKMAGSAS